MEQQLNQATEEDIRDQFVRWWEESYRFPPNQQAIMTHVAFARFYYDNTLASND